MTLTQQTFLGASIRNFNGSLGWNNQTSNLHVGLVEDPANSDNFSPPPVGTAVIFNYQGWQFAGLLQSYREERGQSGNPLYSADVIDPRELLSGVQLILQDYNGPTYGVPNIYNIYGYLESFYGFGGSRVNSTGIPWQLVRDAFYKLQLETPIYFRGAYYLFDPFYGININYGIDLIPSYYRIPGDAISALDYVNHICEVIACDYFVEMLPLDNDETPATNAIEVHLISRNTSPTPGTINSFVDSVDGAVSKRNGFELSNETVSKFVVGGKLNNLYFQNQNYTQNNIKDDEYRTDPSYYSDDVISPYWGTDAYGNLIIGAGDFYGDTGHEYTFRLDGRPIAIQTGKQFAHYHTDLAEMRAARMGQESWEAFLWLYNGDEDSVHQNKASDLGIVGSLNEEYIQLLRTARDNGGDLPQKPPAQLLNTKKVVFKNNNVLEEQRRKTISKVYNYIRSFATEYYGKKFMVRIPYVLGAYDSETNNIRLSLTPTNTGYVNEEYWGVAQFYGYMPYNPEKFTSKDNKLYAYAAFTNMNETEVIKNGEIEYTDLSSKYALDRLSPSSFILDQYPNSKLGKMRENLYVKCNVEENFVFLNPITLFSPRVVVTLDGPIPNAVENYEQANMFLLNELKYLVMDKDKIEESTAQDWINGIANTFGNDFTWNDGDAQFNIPNMVAVPLENNMLRYGPWYITNTAGKVEYENDSSLVPWNYGGFTAMNNAGWAKVTSALRSQQVHESGSVEFPGVPSKTMGSALLSGGPIITDINVNVSDQGVTTSYNMATWTPRFGNLGKYNVERFTQMSKLMQDQRKAFRVLFGYKDPINQFTPEEKTRTTTGAPSNMMIASENVAQGEGEDRTVTPTTVTTNQKQFQQTLSDDTYVDKAAVSMDALYSPYNTNPDTDGNLSHFETPADGATTPTAVQLNPFGSFGGKVTRDGAEIPEDLSDDGGFIKSVALRAPLVLSGWGYDTDGDPVPSGDGDDGFVANYRKRADLWKTGPVDIRWDNDRKVWVASGESAGQQKIGKLTEILERRRTADVLEQDITVSENEEEENIVSITDGTKIYENCRDIFLPVDRYLGVDTLVIISKIDGSWYVTGTAPPC